MHWNSLQEALLNGTGIERSFLCHVHNDSNPSASVNSITGKWYCYTCHAHGSLDMETAEYDPYSVRKQVEFVKRLLDRSETIYPESWLSTTDSLGPGGYWLTRFSEAICRVHRLGQLPDGSAATIPLRNASGELLGVIKRDLTGDDQKYRYPYGVSLSKYLYNYHRADKDLVVLTEGATDTIAFDEVAPGYAMAMYSNRLSKAQARLLYRYSPTKVVVATDQDKAGDLAYESVARAMDGFAPVVRLEWDTYKDLASIPLEERSDLVRYAISDVGLPNHAKVG